MRKIKLQVPNYSYSIPVTAVTDLYNLFEIMIMCGYTEILIRSDRIF